MIDENKSCHYTFHFETKILFLNKIDKLRAQWPFATYLYIVGLWAYLQKIYKVKIYKTTYW